MNQADLRGNIRTLMAPGTLPPMLPAGERIEHSQAPPATKIEVGTQSQQRYMVCGELGPQVSYTYPGGKIVRLHAACDAVWQQERATQ